MKLIIGGRSSGKTEYVKAHFIDEKGNADFDIIENVNDIARELFEKGFDYEEAANIIINKYGDSILLTDEVGNGIVPIDNNEREFREWIGRVQIILARKADEVIRVICGLGQKIK